MWRPLPLGVVGHQQILYEPGVVTTMLENVSAVPPPVGASGAVETSEAVYVDSHDTSYDAVRTKRSVVSRDVPGTVRTNGALAGNEKVVLSVGPLDVSCPIWML
jgi:hypothetical protein